MRFEAVLGSCRCASGRATAKLAGLRTSAQSTSAAFPSGRVLLVRHLGLDSFATCPLLGDQVNFTVRPLDRVQEDRRRLLAPSVRLHRAQPLTCTGLLKSRFFARCGCVVAIGANAPCYTYRAHPVMLHQVLFSMPHAVGPQYNIHACWKRTGGYRRPPAHCS